MATRHLDFGGRGPLIHLATANGFPPEAYRPFAQQLNSHYHVVGYRSRPLWEGSQPDQFASWRDLAHDLLTDLDSVADNRPVVAVGHSLGGIMSLYAALICPDQIDVLVLIDPVILPRRSLPLIWFMRKLNQHHNFPLAQSAARRRNRFSSAEAALDRFRGRGIFAHFTPEALEGYIEGGMRSHPEGGITLAWPSAWESRIFSLVPVDTWDAVARVRQPLLIIRGRNSDLIGERSWHQLRHHLPYARFVELEGGHMVPMEHPATVANTIKEFLTEADGLIG